MGGAPSVSLSFTQTCSAFFFFFSLKAVFSLLWYFAPVAIYNGWLLVGYATGTTVDCRSIQNAYFLRGGGGDTFASDCPFICPIRFFISSPSPSFWRVRSVAVYTMLPVFSIVLDEDVNVDTALTYPGEAPGLMVALLCRSVGVSGVRLA